MISREKSLIEACKQSNLERVVGLLDDDGISVNAKDGDGRTSLHWAAFNGHVLVAEHLLSRGAELSTADRSGVTPLHYACANGHISVVELLLNRGADVNALDRGEDTALHWACREGHLLIAEVLISRGAIIKAVDRYGISPLDYIKDASKRKKMEDMAAAVLVVRALLAKEYTEKHSVEQERMRSEFQKQLSKETEQLVDLHRSELGAQLVRITELEQQLEQSALTTVSSESRIEELSRHLQDALLDASEKDKALASRDEELSIANRNLLANETRIAELSRSLEKHIEQERVQQEQIEALLADRLTAESISNRRLLTSSTMRISSILAIPATEVEIGRRLGEGGFGEVFAGTWAFQPVAIKRCKVSLPEKEEREIWAELETMYHLQHKHVIRLFGVSKAEAEGSPAMIVMEFGSNGSLFDLLHSSHELDWGLRLRICEELASGLAYLHMKNIIHRDIKSLNVVLDEDWHAKWCDFGLAVLKRTATAASIHGSQAGTANWMAPELFDDNATVVSYSVKSDIWALGMIFFEVVSRKLPYQDLSTMQMMFRIAQGRAETVPADCRTQVPGLADWIEKCWSHQRSERPTSAAVLEGLRLIRQQLGTKFSQLMPPIISPLSTRLYTTRRLNREDDLQSIGTVRFTNAIRFDAFAPSVTCVAYLQTELVSLMPQVDTEHLIRECSSIADSRLSCLPADVARLTLDEAVAVVAYTFNIETDQPEQNMYVVLNRLLRQRHGPTIEQLKPYLCYLMRGLAKLPVFEGVVYRGLPAEALPIIQANYKPGHTIQWSAITSTATEVEVAKSEGYAGVGGVVFHISVRSGRRVVAYSAFPDEAEVVLSPNAKFFVSAPCQLQSDGYYKVELVEQADKTFVF